MTSPRDSPSRRATGVKRTFIVWRFGQMALRFEPPRLNIHSGVMNIVAVIKEIAYADPERLFLYGESRGGIMSLLAIKEGFPARAAAVWGAITDLGTADEATRRVAPMIWPGFPANEAEIVESRSAMRWPEKINVPLLIMKAARP